MNLHLQCFGGMHDEIRGHLPEPLQLGVQRTAAWSNIRESKDAVLVGRRGPWLVRRGSTCQHELDAWRVEPLAPGIGQCDGASYGTVRTGDGGGWFCGDDGRREGGCEEG